MNTIKNYFTFFQNLLSKDRSKKILIFLVGYLLGSYAGLSVLVSVFLSLHFLYKALLVLSLASLLWVCYVKYKINDY